jgi:IS30 family transposase
MPAIVDKYIVGKKYDRRVKLTDNDKNDIRELRQKGWTLRQLASEFNVSRRTIQFVVSPHQLEENLKRRKERGGWRVYYTKQSNAEYHANHRNYKRQLLQAGKLQERSTGDE